MIHRPFLLCTTLFLALLTGPFIECNGQWDLYFDGSVPVTRQGSTLDLAWAGGLNFVQVSPIDLNGDGLKDLFLFDRTGNRVTTLINTGGTGTTAYRLSRDYATTWPFPELHDWVLLRDYNCDGKEDIFTYSQAGFSVFKNVSDANGPAFELVNFRVNSNYVSPSGAGSIANLFISQVDLPGIADIDDDGDLDILTFSLLGSYVEYHRNLSIELHGTCDSLTYEVRNKCWGFFSENFSNNSVTLNAPCGFNVPNPEIGPEPTGTTSDKEADGAEKAHSGSTVTPLDLNGDGLKDLLLGDISYSNLVGLFNGGSVSQALMVQEDTLFPSTNISADLPLFPGAFHVDVNNDGKRDLVVSPNATSVSQNFRSMWYYDNTGTDAFPQFVKTSEDLFQGRMIDLGEGAYPVCFDHNGDGLMDLLVANYGYYAPGATYIGKIALFQNVGSSTMPAFDLVTDDYMGLSTSGIGLSMYPAFGDLDNDGDKDMIIGDLQGRLHYYRNISTNSVAQFQLTQANITDAAGTVIDVGQFATPQFYDLDGDGLLDLVIGERNGNLNLYRNSGTVTNAAWTLQSESLGDVNVTEWWNVTGHAVPQLFLNGQGALELLVGSESGWLYHYGDITGNISGTWTLLDSTFLDLNDGPRTGPCLVDLTGDGLLDLVVGNYRGGLGFWRSDLISGIRNTGPEKQAFQLLPNPAQDRVELVTDGDGTGQWILRNALGQTVLSARKTGRRTQVDVSGLANGTYLVQLNGNTGFGPQRLVIARSGN